MKKQTNLQDEEQIYIYVRFLIQNRAVEKLMDFLKKNTKTFDCWWKDKPIGEPINDKHNNNI